MLATHATSLPSQPSPTHTEAAVSRGPLVEALRRLRKNKTAVAGFSTIVFFLAMALAAPVLAPHDPLGAGDGRLILLHILPNCLAPLIVQTTLGFASAILEAAALSFLGLGAQPPTAEWGAMLANGRALILRAWWPVTFPGLLILFSVLGFNLLGDGLRDALDPRLRD